MSNESAETPGGPAAAADAVIALLSDPETHGGREVERVDTHISHLFLVGDRVYKLKRPVRTNFLDFSTPERREAACRRELEVNAGVAGEIYLGLRPVVRRDGALRLGGEGEPVDWVVEMRRFDRSREFDRLAERGMLDVALAEALAEVVARMHREAPPRPEFGGARRVGATVRQIAEAIAATPADRAVKDRAAAWAEAAAARVEAVAAQLDARRRHGRVRRCHGDLHLGNIVMLDGRPTPFDALEFNEEMASTDLLYDVAFALMDMHERGLRDEANAFLARYLSATRDYSGVNLLPLFVSMRAAVRALVAASRGGPQPGAPDAGGRLAFAVEALRFDPAPRLIAVGGLSGSGKSTVARLAAPRLGAGFGALTLRSDLARKQRFGVAPEARLPEAAYRPAERAAAYAHLRRDAARALRRGWPAILDATFLSPEERAEAREVAERVGAPFVGVWLDCPADELRRRVAARKGDASDADLAVLERQLERDTAPADWIHVPAEGAPETVAAALVTALGGPAA